jgi:hypothetical protein
MTLITCSSFFLIRKNVKVTNMNHRGAKIVDIHFGIPTTLQSIVASRKLKK